jgi:hypothetical protein
MTSFGKSHGDNMGSIHGSNIFNYCAVRSACPVSSEEIIRDGMTYEKKG